MGIHLEYINTHYEKATYTNIQNKITATARRLALFEII
jgi:hypothetical protein